jgi:hypothetical protein
LEGFPLAHWLREAEEAVDNRSLADEERASQVLGLIGPEAIDALDEIVESALRFEFGERPIGYYRALAGIGILDDRVLEIFVEGLSHPFLVSDVAACMGEFGTNGRVLAAEALEMLFRSETFAPPVYEDGDYYDDDLQAEMQADRWRSAALASWAAFGVDAQVALESLKEVFKNPRESSCNRVYAAHALAHFSEYCSDALNFLLDDLARSKFGEYSAPAMKALGSLALPLVPKLATLLNDEYTGYRAAKVIASLLKHQATEDAQLQQQFLNGFQAFPSDTLAIAICQEWHQLKP